MKKSAYARSETTRWHRPCPDPHLWSLCLNRVQNARPPEPVKGSAKGTSGAKTSKSEEQGATETV